VSWSGIYLARAGDALAVAFDGDRVWLTRRVTEPTLSCVQALSGGPVVFEGRDTESGLFGVHVEEKVTALVRVDASGAAARIGEFGVQGSDDGLSRARQLAWDPTRKTLWAAVGSAGVLASTAPGAPPPTVGVLS
jgi:hypothetical protein